MPNTDLFDRAEGYGHTAGTQASKDDADWTTPVAVLAAQSEARDTRIARLVDTTNATSRRYKSADLNADGAYAGTQTSTGTNVALANTSVQEVLSTRTINAMDATKRAAVGFRDRSSGYGHSAGTITDLKD